MMLLPCIRVGVKITGRSGAGVYRHLASPVGDSCPVCGSPFDQVLRRKITDSCGHERCYSCMTGCRSCPACLATDRSPPMSTGRTGVSGGGGPLGHHGPTPVPGRSKLKTNGHLAGLIQRRRDSGVSPVRPPPCAAAEPDSSGTYGVSGNGGGLPSGRGTPSAARRRPVHGTSPRLARLPATRQRRTHRSPASASDRPNTLSDTDDEVACAEDSALYARLGLLLGPDAAQGRRSSGSASSSGRSPALPRAERASASTSPASTLTGSSESEGTNLRMERSQESLGSLASVSLSGSNPSASPLICSRRGSLARYAQFRPRQLSLQPLFFEVPQQEQDPLFLGRHWLFAELSRALLDSPARGCLLTGGVGTGKTAAALQLVEHSCFGRRPGRPEPLYAEVGSAVGRERPRVVVGSGGLYSNVCVIPEEVRSLGGRLVAYHFCQSDNSATCLVPDFVHSLAAQLVQAPQLAAYRELVLGSPTLQTVLALRSCVADPAAALQRGVLEPLASLRHTGKLPAHICIIVVDALCEAEYHKPEYGDNLAAFLARHLTKFPSWLKLLVTVRTQMEGIVSRMPLQRISVDPADDSDDTQRDLSEYISFRINNSPSITSSIQVVGAKVEGSGQSRFVAHLVSLAKGSFLFVKLTLDLIEKGKLVMKSSSFRVLPVSLSELFLLNCNLRFPTQRSYELVKPLLSGCIASLHPMNVYEMFDVANAGCTSEAISWDDFMSRLKIVSGFLIKRMDDTYMFFHPSFREWLVRREESESHKFLLDPRIGHASLALRLSRMEAPLDPQKTLEMGHHVLKAHLYKNVLREELPVAARDLQAIWLANASADLSGALVSERNAYSPNVMVSNLLLVAGASPDACRPRDGAPLLGLCATQGCEGMLELLIRFGAAVDAPNGQGLTPLMLASAGGRAGAVRLLVGHGAAVGRRDGARRCALVHAAVAGHLDVVDFLLGCDWTYARDGLALTEAAQQALVAAAGNGHHQLTEYLLDIEEVSLDDCDSLHGETALTMAAGAGHKTLVETLLRRGADVSATNSQGAPPLLGAVREGHWDICVVLLAEGALLEQTDRAGRTALMLAAGEGHTGVLDLLLNKGASVSRQDADGLTALAWACLKGRGRAVRSLLDAGADIAHTDSARRTPLDLAAFQGDAAIVSLLLDRGAVLDHVDRRGMTPLDRAIACANVQVVQCFLRRGAKLASTTWAMADGKPDIMFTLLSKLNDDGMTLYRKCRIQEADHRFTYALKKFPETGMEEHDDLFRKLHVNLLLNLSRCKRKLGLHNTSAELATLAMSVRPEAFEPYFFRAKAKHAQKQLDAALADLNEALRLAPRHREVRRTLLQARDQLRQPANQFGSLDALVAAT
ncbi:Protein TANC2 [Amphibalanus amphitrite]|uniref:Protein TANC2 n=1 Tax=Amphibalanus amphitrite TaxID=1232801 RepID=A0A6A4WZK0_AMPAM|nr:Protein TANC2 [Amphibalanus amphitrite]